MYMYMGFTFLRPSSSPILPVLNLGEQSSGSVGCMFHIISVDISLFDCCIVYQSMCCVVVFQTFDSDHYQTGFTFIVCCFLSLYQVGPRSLPVAASVCRVLGCESKGSGLEPKHQRQTFSDRFHSFVHLFGNPAHKCFWPI